MPRITAKAGLGETLDNQRIMKLVEEALQHTEGEREEYLKQRCRQNPGDFEQALHYVQWEQRMQGFLLDPVIKREEGAPHLEAGDLLENRFRIVRELAQGGMGVVFEAQDEKLGRRIALKCAKAGFGHELPPEVRHATEVSHPNVCKLYEIHTATIREQIVDFITMEFLEGETLASRLNRGRVSDQEAFSIARQLAAGVAEAHRNGVIHGDIKSNNVILTKSIDGGLRAVITDFGLARRQESRSRGIWGTPGYMAPELWLGEQPSVASDIYALGVVFYEMATGEVPSHSKTSNATSDSLKATPWLEAASHKPPPVSRRWDGILGRCLDPDPQKRYKNAGELVAALAPGHLRRNLLLAATAMIAALLTGIVTYKNATAPADSIKLAVVPNETLGAEFLASVDREIDRLEGTKKTAFKLLPARKAAAATHLLRVTLGKADGQTTIHAVLGDPSSQAPLKTWDAHYAPAEWKFAPRALAGVVSAGLHLTPLPESLTVNEKAKSAYLAGTEAMRQNSKTEVVLQELNRALAADSDSPLVFAAFSEAYWMKYYATRDRAWLDRSREALRQSELRYPDTAVGHRAAAQLAASGGQFEDAESELLRAVELEPANAESYRRLGFVYNSKNQFDKALLELRQAVALEPDYYKNQWTLGKFYLDQGRYKEAVEHLLETVKLSPSAVSARYELAVAYTDTGQFAKAQQNLELLPQNEARVRYQEATILMYQNKDTEAVPLLRAAVEEVPSECEFWMQLAVAERHIGQLAQSRKADQQALTLVEHQLADNPRDGTTRALLGYFCAQLKQRDRAESEIGQALQLAPRELNVIWLAVHTYETLGMRDNAISVLRTAPPEMLEDLKRWPDVAALTADLRFIELTANAEKKEIRQ